MKKILTLTLLLAMTTILPIACGDKDEDNNIDYLKGDKELVEKGLTGTWKATQRYGSTTIITYYKYDGIYRWAKSAPESNPWEKGPSYYIIQENDIFKIFLNAQGGVKTTINELSKTTLKLTYSDGESSTFTRVE